MTAFSEKSRRDFELRLVEYLQQAFPEHFVSPEEELESQSMVVRLIDRACAYGLESEKSVGSFVELSFELEEGFEELPDYVWAKEILETPELNDDERMQQILLEIDAFEEDFDTEGLSLDEEELPSDGFPEL